MKKCTKLLLMVLLLVAGLFFIYSPTLLADQSQQQIKLIVNNQEISQSIPPAVVNGRIFFPVRSLGNALNISNNNIYWKADTKTVTLIKGDKTVQIQLDSNALKVNGNLITMDVVPQVVNSKIMLPVSWIARSLDYNVDWDINKNAVVLSGGGSDLSINNSNNTIVTPTPSTTPTTTNNYLEQRKAKVLSELNELKTRLENIKNNKNVQVLKKQTDGTYQYEYQADQDAVDRAQRLYDSKYELYQSLTR